MALRNAHMPTAPRPITATDPPSGMSARLAAAQPVARLSVSSRACSVLIPSGIFSSWKSAAGTASSSGLCSAQRPGAEDLRAVHAADRVMGGAPRAAPASGDRGHQDPVADGETGYLRAGFDHRADRLMPEGDRVEDRVVPFQEVQVGSADGGGLHLDDGAVRAGQFRVGPCFHADSPTGIDHH